MAKSKRKGSKSKSRHRVKREDSKSAATGSNNDDNNKNKLLQEPSNNPLGSKRKLSSKHNSRRKRRTPVTEEDLISSSNSSGTGASLGVGSYSYFGGGKLLSESKEAQDRRMFAISHHVSFVPTLPQGMKFNSISSLNALTGTGASSSTGTCIAHETTTTKQDAVVDSSDFITPAQYKHYSQRFAKDPAFYQLFHPRNLGTSLPTPKPPPWESEDSDIYAHTNAHQEPEWKHLNHQNPHSAGCRMNQLIQPEWLPLPQPRVIHMPSVSNEDTTSITGSTTGEINELTSISDIQDLLEPIEIVRYPTTLAQCPPYAHHSQGGPTFQKNSHRQQPQQALFAQGDTSGHVALYSKLPLYRPMATLATSASRRYLEWQESLALAKAEKQLNKQQQKNNKKLKGSVSSSSSNAKSATNTRVGKIGRGTQVVKSSVDRGNAVECLGLGRTSVVLGTRIEVERIGFGIGPTREYDDATDGYPIWKIDLLDDVGYSNGRKVEYTETRITGPLEHMVGMVRGPPTRLEFGNGEVVLASFSFGDKKRYRTDKVNADCDGLIKKDELENTNDGKEMKVPLTKDCYWTATSPIWVIPENGIALGVIPREKQTPQHSSGQESISKMNSQIREEPRAWMPLTVGPRAMAIWDQSNSSRILAVFLISSNSPTDNELLTERQELLLLDASTYNIINRAIIPSKISGSKVITVEAINQSAGGELTIAATSARGGIRVFETDNLALIATYGEGVSLHGHTILWQNCFFVRFGLDSKSEKLEDDTKRELERCNGFFTGDYNYEKIIERVDEIQHRGQLHSRRQLKGSINLAHTSTLPHNERIKRGSNQDCTGNAQPPINTSALDGLYIVSVPHAFREPVDMKETIHFWDLSTLPYDGGTKLPSFTLKGPKKSEGIFNLLFDDSLPTAQGGRFLISTHSGDCYHFVPTLTSDWAGCMYPIGFRVLDDNIAYIEDEDELDEVVDNFEDYPLASKAVMQYESTQELNAVRENDVELMKALQVSAIEEHVDVLGCEELEEDMSENTIVPCRPQVHLKDTLTDTLARKDPNVPSLDQTGTSFGLLQLLPQFSRVRQFEKEERERDVMRKDEMKQALSDASIPSNRSNKRSRAGQIEMLINKSVNQHKELVANIVSRGAPTDGTGSAFSLEDIDSTSASSNNDKQLICEACLGRFVIHTCGKRAIPIDFEGIAKAKQEKEAKELRIKKEMQIEKRRAADARRREAKKKQKEEEKHRREDDERVQKESLKVTKNDRDQQIIVIDVGNNTDHIPCKDHQISSISHKDERINDARYMIEPISSNNSVIQPSPQQCHGAPIVQLVTDENLHKNQEGSPTVHQEEQLDATKLMIEAISSNHSVFQTSNEQMHTPIEQRESDNCSPSKNQEGLSASHQEEQLDAAKLMIEAISSNHSVIKLPTQLRHAPIEQRGSDNSSPSKNQGGLSTRHQEEQLDAAKLMIEAISSNIRPGGQSSNEQRHDMPAKTIETIKLSPERKDTPKHLSEEHDIEGELDGKISHSVQNNIYNLSGQSHTTTNQEQEHHQMSHSVNVPNPPQHIDENRYKYSRQLQSQETSSDQNDYKQHNHHQIQFQNYHRGNHFSHTQENYQHEGYFQNQNGYQQEGDNQNQYHHDGRHQIQKQQGAFPLAQQQYASLNRQHYSLPTDGHHFQPQHINQQNDYPPNGFQDRRYTQQPHVQNFPQHQDQFGTMGSHYMPHSNINCNQSSQNSSLIDHEKRPLDRSAVSVTQPGHVYQEESRRWL